MLPNLSPLVAAGPSNALARCSVCASLFQKTSPTGCKKCSKQKLAKENEDPPMSSKKMRRSMLRQHTMGHPRREWAFAKGDEDGDEDKNGTLEASYASLDNPRAPGYREEAMDYREEAMNYLRMVAEFPDEYHEEVWGDASGAHFRGRIIPDEEWEQMKRDAERQVGTRPGP
jgi:predicted  nucleic acid-binding Zn-ribbon protein